MLIRCTALGWRTSATFPKNVRAAGCKRGLADDAVVIGVRADPKPQDAVRNINTERAIMSANSHRMKPSDSLEVERGVARVCLEKGELLVG